MDPGTGRQRRSADMARKSRFRPSPSHGCRQCPGQTLRNCGVSTACVHGPRFAGKRVVVDAVSSEPVSAEFPVKQGINRDFSQNHPLIRPVGPLTHWYRWPFGSNSLNIGTGNFFSGTGNLIRGTGNYLGGSGNRPTVRRGTKSGARKGAQGGGNETDSSAPAVPEAAQMHRHWHGRCRRDSDCAQHRRCRDRLRVVHGLVVTLAPVKFACPPHRPS